MLERTINKIFNLFYSERNGECNRVINPLLHIIIVDNFRCGTGDIAKSKRDIGFFRLSDSCCREHV